MTVGPLSTITMPTPCRRWRGHNCALAIGDPRGLDALDLGCGTGRHSLWLAEAGANVTAIDFSEGMLAEARRKPGRMRSDFSSHDLHRPLPFADAAFDLAVSGLVLEHLSDLVTLFRKLTACSVGAGDS